MYQFYFSGLYWLNPATDKIDKEGKQFDATDLPVIGTIALFGSSDMDYAFVFFFYSCNHIMYKKKVKRKNILFFVKTRAKMSMNLQLKQNRAVPILQKHSAT